MNKTLKIICGFVILIISYFVLGFVEDKIIMLFLNISDFVNGINTEYNSYMYELYKVSFENKVLFLTLISYIFYNKKQGK